MSGTYKATGITLKSSPFGENDRLLTILTPEVGLVRAIAPGARKHQSRLRGRSGIFVINQLLLTQGRSLDKVVQAESLSSFPKLSQNLGKLTAGQYLAEIALCEALSQQPQVELFTLLSEHLERLESCENQAALAFLVHGMFHLLALEGIAPQVRTCSLTQQPLVPVPSDPSWRVGFAPSVGGAFLLQLEAADKAPDQRPKRISAKLSALELLLMQQLSQPDLLQPDGALLPAIAADLGIPPNFDPAVWRFLEKTLRGYLQYHFDRTIHSATLIESCF
ncbi:MAG: DNA repair protein RecO [Elainellaceae cyanobacterium]